MDLEFSIIHHSIFITHNSKYVGPTSKMLFWTCFHFRFPSSTTHQNKWWMSENKNKKKVFSSYGNRVMVAFWKFHSTNGPHGQCIAISMPAFTPPTALFILDQTHFPFFNFFNTLPLISFSSLPKLTSPYLLVAAFSHPGLPLQLKKGTSFGWLLHLNFGSGSPSVQIISTPWPSLSLEEA